MNKFALFLAFLLGFCTQNFAQINEQVDHEVLLKRETSTFFGANSNGISMGYRSGWFKTGYKLRSLEFSLSNFTDLKQIKLVTQYQGARSFYYGKLIHLYNFRALYGMQNTLTTKPYWGGVEFRGIFEAGFSMGFGKPIYLYVANSNDNNNLILIRYQEDNVLLQDIYGRGPWTKGFSEMEFYPSVSFKIGLNAEFGELTQIVRAFETGIILDAYLFPVKIMAFEEPKYLLFQFYLSYHFGKRFNP